MSNYFKSKQERDLENSVRFDSLIRRISQGLNSVSVIQPLNSPIISYKIGKFFEDDDNGLIAEFDQDTGALFVKFNIEIDNQAKNAIGLVRGKSIKFKSQVVLPFDKFNDETEFSLGWLIKDYFERGAVALKEIIYEKKVQPS